MDRRAFIRSAAGAAALSALRPTAAFAEVTSDGQLPDGIDAVTGEGTGVRIPRSALADLRARVRGPILFASDPGYDEARRLINPAFDRRPALIVQPTGAADIRTAVQFAREHGGLLLAVKCGGHSQSGQSTCDRGLLVDLSRFRDVRIDPAAQRAWVTGGSLLGAVDHETATHELVTPLGTVSHTGVGGLVTGGGFGRLARKYGLSIDNLLSVQIVTADGELRYASTGENPDLFWGVRGGGGNFGIVTSFELQLHPMRREVIGGNWIYPISRSREILTRFGEFAPQASDELYVGFQMLQPPGNAAGEMGLEICYCGPESEYERAVEPLRRSLGPPAQDTVKRIAYTALQKSGDVSDPRALAIYLKSGFIPALGPDLAEAIVESFTPHPARFTAVFFQSSGGAIARVSRDATAFPHRSVLGNLLTAVGWPAGQSGTPHIEAIRALWSRLEPFTEGFYFNDLDPDHKAKDILSNYQRNLERLTAVKTRYDPSNLFRLNANVKPATPRAA